MLLSATTVGNYAIFAGGTLIRKVPNAGETDGEDAPVDEDVYIPVNTVDIFKLEDGRIIPVVMNGDSINQSMNENPTDLSDAQYVPSMLLGDKAKLSSKISSYGTFRAGILIFPAPLNLKVSKVSLAATTVGNYAIFAEGMGTIGVASWSIYSILQRIIRLKTYMTYTRKDLS